MNRNSLIRGLQQMQESVDVFWGREATIVEVEVFMLDPLVEKLGSVVAGTLGFLGDFGGCCFGGCFFLERAKDGIGIHG